MTNTYTINHVALIDFETDPRVLTVWLDMAHCGNDADVNMGTLREEIRDWADDRNMEIQQTINYWDCCIDVTFASLKEAVLFKLSV